MVVFDNNNKNNMSVYIEQENLSIDGTPKSCLKRSQSFGIPKRDGLNPFKKVCLSARFARKNSDNLAAFYSDSNESEDDNSEDNDACYVNNQRRARKRAFSLKSRRSSSFSDDRLNHAISKYSDEDDEENVVQPKIKCTPITDEVKEVAKPKSPISKVKENASNGSMLFPESGRSSRKSSAGGDQLARNRCFEYLVGAIDEAWARYCDATSYAEDEALNKTEYLPNTPASLGLSEPEEDDDEEEDFKDEEDGYKSASTNITEYDSEVDKKFGKEPSSLRLQQLKDRLLKAKYYLQDYVDSYEEEDCLNFWKRWDLVKYATIELVEDDDDDEVIESTIEDLERGRLYFCE